MPPQDSSKCSRRVPRPSNRVIPVVLTTHCSIDSQTARARLLGINLFLVILGYYREFLNETTYSAVMSQYHDEDVLVVNPVMPNLTPYIGTEVLAISIHVEFDGTDEYPLKAPPEKTAGVKLGTKSMTQSSCPVKVATVSYCIRSVVAAGAVVSSRSMTTNALGTAALGEAVLNTEAALVLARMYTRTRSKRYWSNKLENVDELARSDSWNDKAPKTPVGPFCRMELLPERPVEFPNVSVICLVENLAPGYGREGGFLKE